MSRPDTPGSAAGDAGKPVGKPAGEPMGEQAGDQIGAYKLLQRIGEGGFGTVWMADQREPVKRRVALKILKPGMDTKQVVARFEVERQALALMDHPNIAKVLDAGASGSGRPYFVMELVRGVPILEYCDTEKLETQERLALFVSVCHAIQHAHHKGVIHRDVKPSNVMVTMHDGVPIPKVIDFGVAKAIHQPLTQKTLFTEYRQMVGTPASMSPEQAEMSGLDVDTRADVYSLGVLLYELLTGTTPFDVRSLLESGYDEMLRAIREDEPPKPSTRVSTLGEVGTKTARLRHTDARQLCTLLRGDLDWIVMRCLEKDRQRRYQTASGLADDVRRHLEHEPVVAGPPTRTYRIGKFVRRHRRQVIAGGLVAAVLVLGAFGTTTALLRAWKDQARVTDQTARASAALRLVLAKLPRGAGGGDAERDPGASTQSTDGGEVEALARTAVELVRSLDTSRREARRELHRAREVTRLIQEMLSGVDPDVARTEDTALLEQILDETAARLRAGEVDDELVDAELRRTVAGAYWSLGKAELAAPLQAFALEIHRRLLGDDHPDTLVSVSGMARILRGEGKLAEAAPLYREAFEARHRVLGPDDPLTLASTNNMGVLLDDQGHLAGAETYFREALEGSRRVLGDGHPETLRSLRHLGRVLRERGRLAESEAMSEEALRGSHDTLGHDHPETLRSQYDLGAVLMAQGRLGEAEPRLAAAHHGARQVLGDEHPVTVGFLGGVASLLQARGRPAEAEPLLRQVLEGQERLRGSDHLETFRTATSLAIALLEQGKLSEAERRLRDALERGLRVYGRAHPMTLQVMDALGVLLRRTGELTEAESYSVEVLDTRRRRLGEDHILTLRTRRSLALLRMEQGQLTEAEQLFRETLEGCGRTYGRVHWMTTIAVHNLALVLARLERRDEALALSFETIRLFREHPDWPRADWWSPAALLGDLLVERGRAAVDAARESPDPLALGAGYADLGSGCLLRGELQDAERFLARSLGLLTEALPEDDWRRWTVRSKLGEALARQGRYADAELHLLESADWMLTSSTTAGQEGKQEEDHTSDALRRLIELYRAWDLREPGRGHDARSEEWRAELEAWR